MPGKLYTRADFLKQYTRQERLNRKVSALLALLWGTVWMGAGAAVLGNLVKLPSERKKRKIFAEREEVSAARLPAAD